MKKMNFNFEVSNHGAFPPPAVRVWVDANRNDKLDDYEEVKMDNSGKLLWEGSKDFSIDKTEGIWFLVAYIAKPGETWNLKVKSGDSIICEGSGTITAQRDSFWGVCK